MKRRFLPAVSALAFFFLFAGSAPGAEFWASKISPKYHYPSCAWAQKILVGNLVKFDSPEEAIKAGFQPCRECKPPTAVKSEAQAPIQSTNYSDAKDTQKRGLLLEIWRSLRVR